MSDCIPCGCRDSLPTKELDIEDWKDEYLKLVIYASAVSKENAKLRELVRDYERCSVHADCDQCEYDGKLSTHCPLGPCFPDTDELRELGVEVEKDDR